MLGELIFQSYGLYLQLAWLPLTEGLLKEEDEAQNIENLVVFGREQEYEGLGLEENKEGLGLEENKEGNTPNKDKVSSFWWNLVKLYKKKGPKEMERKITFHPVAWSMSTKKGEVNPIQLQA